MRYALPCIAILVLLAGCSKQAYLVPATLLDDCVKPTVEVGTNAGLTQGLLEYDRVLQACNDDKAAIRNHLNVKEIQ